MVTLSGKEVSIIHDYLVDHGVDYEPLRDDLVDHLCCNVESKMETGIPFREAFALSVEEFGELGLERTQHAVIYLLTLKLKIMRNLASISGITGAAFVITGLVLKHLHLPPANIMLILGMAVTGLFFLPLILLIKLKEYKTANAKLAVVAGFVSAIVLLFGIMFKMMHWPYANMLIHTGMGILCLGFMPLHFVRSYQQAENKLFNSALVLVIFAGCLLLFRMTNHHSHSAKLDEALVKNLNATIENNNLAEIENEDLKKSAGDSLAAKTAFFSSLVSLVEESEKKTFAVVGFGYKPGELIGDEFINWGHQVVEISNVFSAEILPGLEKEMTEGLSSWIQYDNGIPTEMKKHLGKNLTTFRGKDLSARFINLPLYEVITNLEEMKQLCLQAETALLMHHIHH